MKLKCINCAETYPPEMLYSCIKCDGILEVYYEKDFVKNDSNSFNANLSNTMWRYSSQLSVEHHDNIISLHEGGTPLHFSDRYKKELDGFQGELYFKDETVNPTGSFKDRLISTAISKAKEFGYEKVVCASSGNAGASAAAYAAKSGIEVVILAPQSTPKEKIVQILSYGATVLLVKGHYSDSYKLAKDLSENYGFCNLSTTFLNPYGTDALKTVAYELDNQLKGEMPDYVLIPVGAGPLLKGLYQGYSELNKSLKSVGATIPKLIGVQAEGCSPIVSAFESDQEIVSAWEGSNTIASGISDPLIGYEKDGTYTLKLIRESKGVAISVTDEEIKKAMQDLSQLEGIFAEPTGAAPLAALKKLYEKNMIDPNSRVVCLITGHGFKDMNIYQKMDNNIHYIDNVNDIDSVRRILNIPT
ncbi:threonine synthase [Planococcus beigongshangi]|uniref:threonine synthase n=1 Tax=Planococcus beigongshangi TaxID=2782536 RepID=UPI00193BF1E6|nr:threonine synthase [Planococcus beigongshangi]